MTYKWAYNVPREQYTYPRALIALLGGLAHGRLLQDELLELGGRGNKADLAALLDDAPDPPVGVVLLVDVQVVPNLEGDRRPVHGRVVVLFIVGSVVKKCSTFNLAYDQYLISDFIW